jgi:hypothetical protein
MIESCIGGATPKIHKIACGASFKRAMHRLPIEHSRHKTDQPRVAPQGGTYSLTLSSLAHRCGAVRDLPC